MIVVLLYVTENVPSVLFYKLKLTAFNSSKRETFLKSKPNLIGIKGFEDQYNLLIGSFYFNNNLYDKAEQYFKRTIDASETRDKYSAVRNLVEIYMRQSVDKAKVKNLLDVIDDLDNERLKYRAKDLEKKYNL